MTMTTLLTGVFVLGLPAWLLVEELAYRFGTRRSALGVTRPASAPTSTAAPVLRQRQAV